MPQIPYKPFSSNSFLSGMEQGFQYGHQIEQDKRLAEHATLQQKMQMMQLQQMAQAMAAEEQLNRVWGEEGNKIPGREVLLNQGDSETESIRQKTPDVYVPTTAQATIASSFQNPYAAIALGKTGLSLANIAKILPKESEPKNLEAMIASAAASGNQEAVDRLTSIYKNMKQPQASTTMKTVGSDLVDYSDPNNPRLVYRAGGPAGKPPVGYRYNPAGEQEPIPGGPADVKFQNERSKAEARVDALVDSTSRLSEAAARLKSHPGLAGITGLRGAIPNIPGSQAANAQGLLDNIKTQAAFDTLQNMKNMSKTGGSLGQVSDAEQKMLREAMSSLEKSQDLKSMTESLDRIIAISERAAKRTQTEFDRSYYGKGSTQGTGMPGAQKIMAPRIGETRKGYRYKGGDPGVKDNWEKVM